MARPGGLGKGLGALIPASETAEPRLGLEQVAIDAVHPNPHQPRDHFDEQTLGSLADSIREVGVLQPILVRVDGDGYEIIAGERRWRAAQRAGLSSIPALVRNVDDVSSLQQAIVENVQREQLNPLEEAAAYQELIDEFNLTHEEVAARVGRSRTAISNSLRLLQLPPAVQRFIQDGSIQMGHARALLGTPDRAFQERLARRAAQDQLSVRAVEAEVRDHSNSAGKPTEPKKTPSLRSPGLLELEELLGDYLDTRVKVSMSPKRGHMTIDFATLEDLERIYRLMTAGKPASS